MKKEFRKRFLVRVDIVGHIKAPMNHVPGKFHLVKVANLLPNDFGSLARRTFIGGSGRSELRHCDRQWHQSGAFPNRRRVCAPGFWEPNWVRGGKKGTGPAVFVPGLLFKLLAEIGIFLEKASIRLVKPVVVFGEKIKAGQEYLKFAAEPRDFSLKRVLFLA